MSNRSAQACASLAASLVAVGAIAAQAHAAEVIRQPFGRTAVGQRIFKTVLRNDLGASVAAIDFGATLTAIDVPDRHGRLANIVLSLPSVAAYESNQRRYGAVVGRYAGRITDAKFVLDGVTYPLEAGRNNMTLHGGSRGWDKRVWLSEPILEPDAVGVRFSLLSPDRDQGFPGALRVSVTYRLLRKANALSIEYEAVTSAATVINLTNHAFFNLHGAGQGTILEHRVWIAADRYAAVDWRKASTGTLPPVAGTVLDFRSPRRVADALKLDDELLKASNGLDHSLVTGDAAPVTPRLVGWIEDPASGRRMSVLTTEPSVQINSGQGFDGSEVGAEDVAYPHYAGLAFETQHLPDSPNQPRFPSTTVRPGVPFRSVTVLRFTAEPEVPPVAHRP